MPAAACCALGLSPGGLPGRLVTVGAGTLLLLSLGVVRAGLPADDRVVPLLPRRSQLLLRGPRLLLGGGLRLLRLGQPRLGLPRGLARLPPISLGLLGAGLKPGPGLLGRRDLRLEPGPLPGLVPLGILAGLRHLLLRSLAHPVQLRPGRLGRFPRLGQPRISLPGLGSPCLRGPCLLFGGGLRLLGLGQPPLGLLGAGLKPRPGLLGRRDLGFQPGPLPGLVPLGVLAGLRHLLLRGPCLLFGGGLRLLRLGQQRRGLLGAGLKPRPGLLGRLPRPRRVLPGLTGPGLGLGRPGLGLGRPGFRAAHRLVPLLPRRGHLLLRGPCLLFGGGLRLLGLGQQRLGLLGAGLKPRPGLLGRLPRPRRVLPGLTGPGLGLGRPGLGLGRPGFRAAHRLVPLLPRRGHLLLRGPCLLFGGGLRLLGLGQQRLGLLGAGLKPRPGLLGRLPRPRRVLPGLTGPRDSASAARDSAPRTASSRSCRAAATCSCAARASCSAAAFASWASASSASACSART